MELGDLPEILLTPQATASAVMAAIAASEILTSYQAWPTSHMRQTFSATSKAGIRLLTRKQCCSLRSTLDNMLEFLRVGAGSTTLAEFVWFSSRRMFFVSSDET